MIPTLQEDTISQKLLNEVILKGPKEPHSKYNTSTRKINPPFMGTAAHSSAG